VSIPYGAMGTIKDFVWKTGEHPRCDLPIAIVVEFDYYRSALFQ